MDLSKITFKEVVKRINFPHRYLVFFSSGRTSFIEYSIWLSSEEKERSFKTLEELVDFIDNYDPRPKEILFRNFRNIL